MKLARLLTALLPWALGGLGHAAGSVQDLPSTAYSRTLLRATNAAAALRTLGAPQYVDTVSGLAALSGAVGPATVVARGYATANDGGGGNFTYSASLPAWTATTNALCVAASGGGYWLGWDGVSPVALERWGALGNDGVNDSAALNAAFAACHNLTGGTNTYTVASTNLITLQSNLRLKGGIFRLDGWFTTDTAGIFQTAAALDNVRLEGVTFDGVTATNAFAAVNLAHATTKFEMVGCTNRNTYLGINFRNLSSGTHDNNRVERCWFEALDFTAVRFYNTRRIVIADNDVRDSKYTAIDSNELAAEDTESQWTIANNRLSAVTSGFPSDISMISLLGDRVECTGNLIQGGYYGLSVHTGGRGNSGYRVNLNTLIGQEYLAVFVDQLAEKNVSVTENLISGFGLYGILVRGNTNVTSGSLRNGCIIARNTLVDSQSAPDPSTTYLSAPKSIWLDHAKGVSVVGNLIESPRVFGVYADGYCFGLDISGNQILNHRGFALTDSAPILSQRGACILVGRFASSFASQPDISAVTISRNYLYNFHTAGTVGAGGAERVRGGAITVGREAATTYGNVWNVVIEGNVIDTGNGVGIACNRPDKTSLINNVVRGLTGTYPAWYLVAATDMTVRGNRYETGTTAPTSASASTGTVDTPATVTSEVLVGAVKAGAASGAAGIGSVVQDTTNGRVYLNQDGTSSGWAALLGQRVSAATTVTTNIIATAPTMRVIGSGGPVTPVTVSETGAIAGQLLTLLGAPTLTTETVEVVDTTASGYDLQLAGGAACVLGANDTLTLLYTGTEWVELCRSNN